MVKRGVTAMAKVAAEVEQAGAVCVPNAFCIGPVFLAVLHCMATKEKDSPIERMFADFGATPYAKTVRVINGGIDVPQGPGLGADREEKLIARFRVLGPCSSVWRVPERERISKITSPAPSTKVKIQVLRPGCPFHPSLLIRLHRLVPQKIPGLWNHVSLSVITHFHK